MYRANWIDGNICYWDDKNKNWERGGHNAFIVLKSLSTSNNFISGFINKINWTSGNNDIDKFIQDTQLSAHKDSEISNALEWIPYDRLDDFAKNKFGKVYKANWIDGEIKYWDNKNNNWIRYRSKDVILKSSSNLKNIRTKFTNEVNIPFGITQDPETDNYMIVLKNECEKYWTSGNNDIDKFIQDTQLSSHKDSEISNALEWIPYDKLEYFAKDKFGKVHKAIWIDGKIESWDYENKNWKRYGIKSVILKRLSNLKNIAIEFTNEVNIPFGITQDPETKSYIKNLQTRLK
ncbi:kinase-like domain-containing protein [Rhizophagus irregularis DAOM 181602=DAOM 197198]|nr:kinase-like domain-containing protein [Rhizophagus irregularis DAOM 181602=DAOM 197198]